jgi:hypothetical protein
LNSVRLSKPRCTPAGTLNTPVAALPSSVSRLPPSRLTLRVRSFRVVTVTVVGEPQVKVALPPAPSAATRPGSSQP